MQLALRADDLRARLAQFRRLLSAELPELRQLLSQHRLRCRCRARRLSGNKPPRHEAPGQHRQAKGRQRSLDGPPRRSSAAQPTEADFQRHPGGARLRHGQGPLRCDGDAARNDGAVASPGAPSINASAPRSFLGGNDAKAREVTRTLTISRCACWVAPAGRDAHGALRAILVASPFVEGAPITRRLVEPAPSRGTATTAW
mmetsp:Transcript_74379/g.215544  ORF Transcript_74379/g.215544 Transcript_74379/m.215544 type:complete len:201 (-) Transcript_74379:297-899(-)